MKHTYLPALLVAGALALSACGGGDESGEETSSPAAGQSVPAQADQPRSDREQPKRQRSSSKRARAGNGDGGSSAADAERAAAERPQRAKRRSGSGRKPRPAAPQTPQEQLASLSPAQRRSLHRDLYQQGKRICSQYGPEELAKSIDLPHRDPETVARLYARAYESATPSLALPYEQGCLVGFKRFARNPPKN